MIRILFFNIRVAPSSERETEYIEIEKKNHFIFYFNTTHTHISFNDHLIQFDVDATVTGKGSDGVNVLGDVGLFGDLGVWLSS